MSAESATPDAPLQHASVDGSPRARLFGVEIDQLNMAQAVRRIRTWLDAPQTTCRFVVTPNIDHVVLLQENARLRAAYAAASLVLADGWPVVAASRILGQPLPARVAGSDLVPALFDAADTQRPLRVFLLGAAPGVAERAAAMIHRRWSGVRVVGTYSPPLGFEKDMAENQKILGLLRQQDVDLLVVGLGAPKQELWTHGQAERLPAKVAVCVGATIDFLAGHRRRAPRWMQRVGLEWMYRLAGEPRRLLRRYAKDAVVFPRLVLHQALRR